MNRDSNSSENEAHLSALGTSRKKRKETAKTTLKPLSDSSKKQKFPELRQIGKEPPEPIGQNVVRVIFDTLRASHYKDVMFSEVASKLKGEFEEKALSRAQTFRDGGCPNDLAEGVAGFTTLPEAIEACRPYWLKIPTYANAKKDLVSSDPAHHYDQFWRPFADAGLLYQFSLKEFDPYLVGALNGYVRRHRRADFDESYRVPTLKDYNTRLAGYVDSMFGREIARIVRTIDSRPGAGVDDGMHGHHKK